MYKIKVRDENMYNLFVIKLNDGGYLGKRPWTKTKNLGSAKTFSNKKAAINALTKWQDEESMYNGWKYEECSMVGAKVATLEVKVMEE